MGRTVAPYSWQIEVVRHRFAKFRRSLRRADQALFDALMRYAKVHVQAGVMASYPNPADPVFLSIVLEQERRIADLEARLARLEGREKSEGQV